MPTGCYEVTAAENAFGPQPGEKLIFADALAEDSAAKAKVTLNRLRSVSSEELEHTTLSHPFRSLGGGYEFAVPMLAGDHVTDDAGTGFVHTAPGHGREDFDAWMDAAPELRARGIETAIPFTVDDAGFLTKDAPGFGPDREGGAARVIDDNGKKGDANQVVIDALIERGMLFARGRLKHSYPHSWRSKKPVIFRNTPQWFVHMDKELGGFGLRAAPHPLPDLLPVKNGEKEEAPAPTPPSPRFCGERVRVRGSATPSAPAHSPPSTRRASCRTPGRRACAP